MKPLEPKYDAAVAEYAAGRSIGALAADYGVSRQSMWATLKRRGCEFRPQRRTGADNHFSRETQYSARAHDIMEKAIARGELVRRDQCEQCGSTARMKDGRTAVQAHHCDYSKPLDVMWLCQACHFRWHETNQSIPPAPGALDAYRMRPGPRPRRGGQ